MKRNAFILPVLALFLLLSFPPSLPAQQEVKIGVIYPMSGPIAQAGLDNRHAIELALEIINTTKHKDLNLPLAKTVGLPNLGGAKLSVVFADHQGKPDLGLSEAERLLTQEKVVALCGCYNSNVTETASMVAERLKMPFFNPESSSPRLTRRGFKWFFRSTPHDETFSEAMFKCLVDLEKKRGTKFKTIAVAYEDSLYGKDSSRIEKELAEKAGYKVVADIPYRRSATSLTSEVQKLKAANPDVLFPDFLRFRRDPSAEDLQRPGLQPDGDHGPELGTHGPVLHRGGGEGRRRDCQPVGVFSGPGRQEAPGEGGQRPLQAALGPGFFWHLRAGLRGFHGPRRCHQPGRVHPAGSDPGSPDQDRYSRRPADHALAGREI